MDERLVSMYRRFTWRILSNYVTPWEFEQLKAEITDYGHHGDLPGRGAHPQQPLVPGAAAGGRLARGNTLTGGGCRGLLEGGGQAGCTGAVHRPVGGHYRPVWHRWRHRRGGAARRPGLAHRRAGDRRDLQRRGDERVLGAVRGGAAPAHRTGGGAGEGSDPEPPRWPSG